MRLTRSAHHGDNSPRGCTSHFQRRPEAATRVRYSSAHHRRAVEVSVRAQHHAAAWCDSLCPQYRGAIIATRSADCGLRLGPERARELTCGSRAHPAGLSRDGVEGWHHRLARGESADGDQRGPSTSTARTRRAERLASHSSRITRRRRPSLAYAPGACLAGPHPRRSRRAAAPRARRRGRPRAADRL